MSDTIAVFGKLYSPLLLGLWCFFAMWRDRGVAPNESVVTLRPLGVFGVSIPIGGRMAKRTSLALAGFISFAIYGLYDYSSLFPQKLAMEVFFDEEGVERTLDDIMRGHNLAELNIPLAFAEQRGQYFELLDREVENLFGGAFFSSDSGIVHSAGTTSFVVSKLRGWQRYHIDESKGELLHTFEGPRVPTRTFFTLFEKLSSADDYLHMSIADAFLHGGVLIAPRFKQLLAENRTSQGVTFNVSVVGVTKIKVFPWPSFSSTLYCADFEGIGLIPVAYAIYK